MRNTIKLLIPGVLGGGGGGGVVPYLTSVLNFDPSSLIVYFPLNELSGTVADNAEGTAARDGAYVNATPGTDSFDAQNAAPTFDGTGDAINIHSASLSTAFPALEGTAMVWGKFASGVLATATQRRLLTLSGNTAFDLIFIEKTGSANTLRFEIRGSSGGNTQKFVTAAFSTDLVWAMFAVTWSQAGDAFKAYVNGAQVGTTQTTFNDFVLPLSATGCAIGASTGTTGATSMQGSLAHMALWDTPFSEAQLLQLFQAANPT